MTERASIAQVVQMGVETTHGVAVPANKKLSALMLKPKPQGTVKGYRAAGNQVETVYATGKRWSSVDVSGVATYNEIVYPLSSVLGLATITTPGGGTLSRKWDFVPAATGGDTYASYTIEHGDAGNASSMANGVFTDFAINWTRDDVSVTGTMLATAMTNGITMTATPTALDLIPILGDDISVYMDNTSGALGGTKLDRAFTAGFSVGSRRGALWTLDASQASFANTVETVPKYELKLRYMKNSVSDALYATLDANDTRFFRIEAVGQILETTIPYKVTVDFAAKLSAVPGLDDQDNVYCYDFTAGAIIDPTWGKFVEIAAVNKLTAL